MRSWAWLLGVATLWLLGCGNPEGDSLAQQVLGQEGFRGAWPGQSFAEARKGATGTLRHSDELGLAYAVDIGEGRKFFVEYYRALEDSSRLASIVGNVQLGGEAETAQLYADLEEALRQRFGLPEGEPGEWAWEVEERNLQVDLRLLPNKESITLNFASLDN